MPSLDHDDVTDGERRDPDRSAGPLSEALHGLIRLGDEIVE